MSKYCWCTFTIVSKSQKLNLDELIGRLLQPPTQRKKKSVDLTEEEILALARTAICSFQKQESLLQIQSPVKVCGDVHGQYSDLLKLFRIGGCPSETRYLFLGDYVDRGRNSLETICLLLALKCQYPKSFYMIRGNHECAPINRVYGFFSEIKRRFNCGNFMKVYVKLNQTFNYIPLAAVIDRRAFCCHGGISPALTSLKCVNAIRRPVPPRKSGLAADILWSDPDEDIDGFEKQNRPDINPKHRGLGYLWGTSAHANFLKTNRLNLIIRAHECVDMGYRWTFGKQLITVFSAPNYSDGNYAAIATYNCDGSITFTTFK